MTTALVKSKPKWKLEDFLLEAEPGRRWAANLQTETIKILYGISDPERPSDDVRTLERKEPSPSGGFIDRCISIRHAARKRRDFGLADRIRKTLDEKGIELKDTSAGTQWQRNHWHWFKVLEKSEQWPRRVG